MNFKNKNGVSLVTLIITIIVMLIIASVSLSIIIGDNNTIDKAHDVKSSEEQRSKKELLEQALIKFNNEDYIGNYNDLGEYLSDELNIDEGEITENGDSSYTINDFLDSTVELKKVDGFWEIESFETK